MRTNAIGGRQSAGHLQGSSHAMQCNYLSVDEPLMEGFDGASLECVTKRQVIRQPRATAQNHKPQVSSRSSLVVAV
jgi:hypothetical protein